MYTLRTVTTDGITHNLYLGRSYTVIKESDSYEDFQKIQKVTEGSIANKSTYAYVEDENGSLKPLFNFHKHYIVTESGSTLERL